MLNPHHYSHTESISTDITYQIVKSYPCCPTVTAALHTAKQEHLGSCSHDGSWEHTATSGSDLCSPQDFSCYRIYAGLLEKFLEGLLVFKALVLEKLPEYIICLRDTETLCMFILYLTHSWAWRMVSFQKLRNYFLSSAKPEDVSCFVCFKTKHTKSFFTNSCFDLTFRKVKKQFGKMLATTSFKLSFAFTLFLAKAFWQ